MEPNPFLELHDSLAGARRRFLDEVAPLRPELFRYARGLTGSVWDAEDLVQDTLTRAFASLGKFERVRNVRAYLFRVATNAWLDEQRRRRPSPLADEHAAALEDPSVSVPPVEWREALEILLGTLPPRARGAVLLRDVFGFSAAETAAALVTTVGAVKAALARGRRALANQGEPTVPELQHAVAPEVVDAFVDAFNARDLDAVLALVAPEATTEVVGIYTDTGPEAARNVVSRTLCEAGLVRAQAVVHRGERLVVLWYEGDVVGDLVRIESTDGRVTRYRSYYYAPEVLQAIGAAEGVRVRTQGYCVD